MTRSVLADDSAVRDAAALVRQGGLVAYPTDTVYGLGCDPFNPEAVERLVRSKNRKKGSLPVLVESMGVATQFGMFSHLATRLSGRFWPGPLTLVVPLKASLPPAVTGDSSMIGLRIPNHAFASKLIKSCGGAIIGTSANLSGNPSPKTAAEVMVNLRDRVDLVIDDGPISPGKESTVAMIVENSASVLREGAIRQDEILNAIRQAPAT